MTFSGINLSDLAFFHQGAFAVVTDLLLWSAALLAFGAILVNFLMRPEAQAIRRSRRSLVETGSMIVFFVVFFLLCLSGIGEWPQLSPQCRAANRVAGLLLIYFGLGINLAGRRFLGRNWGNQILIYKEHSLIRHGLYRHVRHPLYASTILMLFGLALVYGNVLVVGLNALLFIPFMVWRVRQEEGILVERFPDYAEYRRTTGMFLPRRGGRHPQ